MNNFVCNLSTRVYFGKGQIEALAEELSSYKSILIVYGGGSIKKNGIYEKTVEILNNQDIKITELSGVQPNPRISSVRKGVELCRQNNVDFILAVGSGSVIDCAKAIAFSTNYGGDAWDFFLDKAEITEALPLGTILTLAATGSEMNPYCVISNDDTQQKYGASSEFVRPKFSILDPEYTFTVPADQTAAGSADIMSHVFEQYFSHGNAYLQDRMSEAVLKTVIEFAPKAIANPEDYDARANLMWAGSIALNDLLGLGKRGDWATHNIEHEISAIYDLTHGVGLAILFPNWMKYILDDENVDTLATYATNVWGIHSIDDKKELALKGIQATRDFFNSLNLPDTLSKVNINEEHLELIAERGVSTYRSRKMGTFKRLEYNDVLNILKMSL